MPTRPDELHDVTPHAATILEYWFSTLDDTLPLDPAAEPFRTCYQRWYRKDPAVDADIKRRFEPLLLEAVQRGRRLDDLLAAWARVPRGLLSLVVLLDQLPRNMYRDSARMYAHDPLALAVTLAAIRAHDRDDALPLVCRMFLYVPLMHVENLTLQQYMLVCFDELLERARTRSPHNLPFFEHAHDYARRHVDAVQKFGRFPHRNAILRRQSTDAEQLYLRDHPGF